MCSNISSLNEANRLSKILSKSKDFQIDSLRNHNGESLSDESDVLNHLFETHFPGCEEQTSHVVPEFFEGANDSWVFARKLVTVESIKWAVDSFAPYKSSGKDGIFPALLQKGYEVLKHVLRKILVCSLATGYVPPAWREICIKEWAG